MLATRRIQISICHAFFIANGLFGNGVLPPLVKSFEDTYALSHSQMGSLLSLGTVLGTLSALIAGVVFDRWGPRIIMGLAMALCALAALAVWAASTAWMFAIALSLFMFGLGLTAPINPLVAVLYGPDQMRGMNLSHGLQGVGNLLAPVAVGIVLAATAQWKPVFLLVAATFMMLSWAFFFGMQGLETSVPPSGRGGSRWERLKGHLSLWLLFGMLGFVFIPAAESTIRTWLQNFLQTEAGLPQSQAFLALTCTMLGYTAVRVVLGLRSRGAGRRFMLGSIFLFVLSFAIVIHVQHVPGLFLSGALLGFSFGAYWPSLAATVFLRVPERRGITSGLIAISNTLGSFVALNLFGWLADLYSLRQALFLAPFSALIFVAIFWWLTRE